MNPEQGAINSFSGIRDPMAFSSGIRAPLVLEIGHLSVSGIRARHVLEFGKGSLEFSERVCCFPET